MSKQPPHKRWTWRFVHPLLYWKFRFLMAVWMEFPPESWVTRTFNWGIERIWPFSWARRQYSMAAVWMVFQKTPFMAHLTAKGLIEREGAP